MTADVTTAPSPPHPSFVRRHRVTLALLGVLASGVGGVALWILVTLKFSYSTGDRVGYVQKFSRKGWVCRTWEGELAMTPVPGSQPEIFEFTVPNPAVAKKLADLEGRKVALHYEEKKGIPSSCFGDTRYFVTDVHSLAQ